MRIPLDRLLDGALHALTNNVMPHVPDRFARGQLWSVVDILNNLRERIDWKAGPLEDETTSAVSVLHAVTAVLREAGHNALAAQIPIVSPDGAPSERVAAARAALVTTLELLATLPASPAHALINGHLAMNALRDLQIFKLSLLQEISKG